MLTVIKSVYDKNGVESTAKMIVGADATFDNWMKDRIRTVSESLCIYSV